MGLFSSKKIIQVSSTLYNLAGPEEDRPDYLKGVVFNSVIQNQPSIADTITKSYLSGPGIRQRIFYPYAVKKSLAGLPVNVVNTEIKQISDSDYLSYIPKEDNQRIVVQNAEVNAGDANSFIEQWILENHQNRVDEEWSGDYNESDNTFEISFPNGDSFEFTNSNYSPSIKYLEVRYLLINENQEEGEQISSETTTESSKGDLEGFTLKSSETLSESVSGTRRTTTSDSQSINEESIQFSLNRSIEIWERTDTTGVTGHTFEGVKTVITLTGADELTNDYLETSTDSNGITTTITGDQVTEKWIKQVIKTEVETDKVVGEKIWLRQIASNDPATSSYVSETDNNNNLYEGFYPFLPIRLNNVSLREDPYLTNGLYEETKKAYFRVTDQKRIKKILDQVEENEQIDDIDYAYIVYGVSLNVQEQACRRYIWDFLIKLSDVSSESNIDAFEDSVIAYEEVRKEIKEWEKTDWSDIPWDERPPRPVLPNLSVPDRNLLAFQTDSPLMPIFDIRIEWNKMEKTSHSGKFSYILKEDEIRIAKKDEVQFKLIDPYTYTTEESYETRDGRQTRVIEHSIHQIAVFRQITNSSYEKIVIRGLTHYNYIYRGKAVKITSSEAIEDSESSGFFFPLHFTTFKEMGIKDYTQMATANTHILFNSYKVTKRRWYQRFFAILLIIIIIVVAIVILNPELLASASGLLGSNASVGAALGFTGTAAIVAGFVANYLASTIVFEILNEVGEKLFGEEYAALFAALVSLFIHFGTNGFNFDAESVLKSRKCCCKRLYRICRSNYRSFRRESRRFRTRL